MTKLCSSLEEASAVIDSHLECTCLGPSNIIAKVVTAENGSTHWVVYKIGTDFELILASRRKAEPDFRELF